VLIHGVTGSGKTEVYLSAIAAALARGRGAIYLLPEIALTPQTLARISARFGGRAAALHSALSAGERCRVHEGAARGEIRVVVGPRSAVFAPVRDLAVIVVDEEHETSFKQEEKPRYHARHAALARGRIASAAVLLGSATPDLESYRNAITGRYRRVVLERRLGAELPPVSLVDLRGKPAADGFSARMTEAIEQTLAADRQVVLYYNRRGFARALQCADCGEAAVCPRCDIALTYHLRPRRLLCHYCGFARSVFSACPACAGESFVAAGGGTEKVEMALHALFPGVATLRLDQDSTRRRGSHARILAAFAAREASILVGTQMVTKGHHFPGVELVGVLAADDGLTLPDYRAAERAFQLLTQVAGRAGRTRPGRVVFQTYRPEDPVIQAAAAHDYEAFIGSELETRQQLDYPPFQRLIRLAVNGRRLGAVERAAAVLAAAVSEQLANRGVTVLGPAPAVFPRLQDRHRRQILLKGQLSIRQKRWLAACTRALESSERGVSAFVDVDPLTIY
jgi:primosomal protein N' (replication factor Y)